MDSKARIAKALSLCTDTKVFEMGLTTYSNRIKNEILKVKNLKNGKTNIMNMYNYNRCMRMEYDNIRKERKR